MDKQVKEQKRRERGAITARMLTLINDAHPLPITSGEAAKASGYTMNQCSAAINKAGKQGYCYCWQSGKGGALFAFASFEAAEAYGFNQLADDSAKLLRERNCKHTARANKVIPAKPGVPANVHIPKPSRQAWADRVSDTSGAKLTVCPSPQFSARWQYRMEAPDERWPSFAQSKPGIDPATGRAWA